VGEEPTAVDRPSSARDHLIALVEEGGLDAFDDLAFVGFRQRFEQRRHRLSPVDHRAVRDGESRRLPDTLTHPSMIGVLSWALRLSRGEASRRVRAAEAVGERVTMTGETLPPLRPALAAVQRDGLASPEQVSSSAWSLWSPAPPERFHP